MSFKIQLRPSGHEFEVEAKETILGAGMRAGLNLAHTCMNGSCGECQARLLEGEIIQLSNHDFRLTEQQKNDGYFLTCCHQPVTDLSLEMHEIHDPIQIPFQEIIAKVSKLERLQDEVIQLQLRAPRSKVLDFLGGQRVSLCLPNGSCEVLGIASCPCESVNLRFHVRHADSSFAEYVFNGLSKGDPVQLFGPVGDFTLNEHSRRPLIFIVSETGFAQVQSIIDHAISIDPDWEIDLYWLSAFHRGHYLSNYCRMWRDVLDNFRYQSIDMQPIGEMTFAATLELMSQLQTNLTDADIYAVLPPQQLTALQAYLDKLDFPFEQLKTESV